MRQRWKAAGCGLLSMVLLSAVTAGQAIAHTNDDNQLRRGNFLEPESLDPHVSRGVEASTILRDLYEGLVREGPDGKILPGVAESWQVDAGSRRWVFTLHDNAGWSNGDPVTAGDFVYAFRRALSPATATPFADSLAPIENAAAVLAGGMDSTALGVRALDEYTLEIRLERPVPYLLELLAHHSTYPVHAASIEKHGNAFTRPGNHVSNGAYQLDEWKVNERIVLVRNPHYRDYDKVRIESVAYLPIDDEEAEFNRFRSGEIDITQTIPIRRYAWLVENMPEQLHVTPYLSTYFYGFNLRHEPFRDAPGVRQALSMVIDREILAEKVLGVGELPAYALNPPGIENHSAPQPEYAGWNMEKRIATARRLLKEAGYSAGNPLEVELRFNTGDNHRRVALAVSSMWREHLGVSTRLVNEEWKVFLQNRRNAELTQVFRSAWVGDYNDPTTFLNLLHSNHPLNDYGYRNPEYDALLEAAEREMDATKRRKLLQQAEAIMLADHPVLPLYYYVSKHLVADRVGGWQDNIMDHHATRDLYLRD